MIGAKEGRGDGLSGATPVPSPFSLDIGERLRRRLWLEWAVTLAIALALIIGLSITGATQRFDNLIYDRMLALAPAEPPSDTVLITIDEASLAEYGRWPWPRAVQADLLQAVAQGRPKALGYDIILSDAGDAAGDSALATAMSGLPARVLAVHSIVPGSDGAAFDWVLPLSSLMDGAQLGHVIITPDDDGVVRGFHPCMSDGRSQIPHMAIAIASAAKRSIKGDLTERAQCEQHRRFRLPPAGSIPTIGFAEVAEGRVPADFFRDKLVLVGASAQGLGDRHLAAGTGGEEIAGVELIAGIANAAQTGAMITSVEGWAAAGFAVVPILIFLACVWWLRPRGLLWLTAILALAWLALCLGGLSLSFWIPPGPALAGMILVYPLWGWRRLAAVSDDITAELARFAEDGQLAIADPPPMAVDPLAEQSAALHRMLVRQDNLRRFLGDTMQNLPDPMFATDKDGAVALMSRRAEDELGQAGEQLTREETLLLLVHPDDLNDVRAFLAAPIAPEATIRFRSKHGGSTYLLRRAPMIDASGATRAHIHYFTDITPLEEARRARDEALSLISHDLRAPQAAILAALGQPMDEATKTFITRQAQRTMRLAESFVDLARMREREFAGEEFLLGELVAEVVDDFHPLADAKHIRIVQYNAASESFVVLEMDSIIRALANLFDNAIKFAPEGSVIDVHLAEESREGEAGYALSIRDHGDGIDPALLPRLFGRFQRHEDDGETRRPGGFGLGLSYVAAVVERHRGHAKAEQAEGGGARFTLWFPAADFSDVPPVEDYESLSSADSSEPQT